MPRLLPAATLAATLIIAAPAGAATFCVNDPACPAGGTPLLTVPAAADAAHASEEADLISVGPGTFDLGDEVSVGQGDRIVGAGRSETTLRGRLGLGGPKSTVVASDFELRMKTTQVIGVDQYGGTVERVDVEGTGLTQDQARGVLVESSILRDSRIEVDRGAALSAALAPEVEDVTLSGPVGVRVNDSVLTLRRAVIEAGVGIDASDSNATLDAVAIRVRAGGTGIAVGEEVFDPFKPLRGRHVTIVGDGTGTGVSVVGGCEVGSSGIVELDQAAIGGFETHLRRVRTCDDPNTDDERAGANLTVTRSAYDPERVVSSGQGTFSIEPPVATDLQLDTDLVPLAGSPLIDAGDASEPPGLDVRGLPRPAGAAPDIGAYEYQPPPVEPTPSPSPEPSASPSPSPAPSASPAPAPRTRPKAVRLRVTKVGRRRWAARATVVLRPGQTGSCEAGVARFRTKRPRGSLTTTFDAACHADITVRARKGTRLRVRFGGTETLLAKRSRWVRLA